jgi:hypothetical protein
MGDVPSEERRVIDELVLFWQSRYEPRELIIHIDRLSSTWGSGIGVDFFRQVYQDLRTNSRGKYTSSSSASEFKQFLETGYHQQAQVYSERQAIAQAQAKAEAERFAQEKAREREEREARERRARADFDLLRNEMAKATTREERVELGRRRDILAREIGYRPNYESVCWNCTRPISSAIHAQCPACTYYICGFCAQCLCGKLIYGRLSTY